MKHRNYVVYCCLAFLISSIGIFAQAGRGHAEMKAPGGSVTLNYGLPSLQGRDMLGKLEAGKFWRLGKDEVTVLSTPVNLAFGSKRIPKGTHGLWLKRLTPDAFELVFNKQVTGHGMMHDATKDVASVPMTGSALASPVETLAINLLPAKNGGKLEIRWGKTTLTADFQFVK